MKIIIKMFSVMVMLLVLSSVVYGQSIGKESLKGLKGVGVEVEELNPDIEKDGLRENTIQTDVELKLRMAGIKVLTEEEWGKEPGRPFLYVQVGSVKSKTGIHAFAINLKLHQGVFLERDLKIRCFVATWNNLSIIEIVGASIVNTLRDAVKDHVDEFINDYFEMNPKE